MNEKIRQFAEQAWPELPSNWWERKDGAVAEAVNKFAELIIKECSQLILDETMGDLGDNPGVKEWEEGYNEAVHDCYYRIRHEFGVEE